MQTLLYDLVTSSPEETEALGRTLASRFASGEDLSRFLALYGDLGVGKTAFVRGFAGVFSRAPVRSPTFSLVNEYPGTTAIFHFDMYRIESEDDLESIGFYEYLDRGICLAEWCEKIPFALPPRRLRVTIEKNDPASADARRITVSLIEDGGERETL